MASDSTTINDSCPSGDAFSGLFPLQESRHQTLGGKTLKGISTCDVICSHLIFRETQAKTKYTHHNYTSAKALQSCPTFLTLWTLVLQVPLSMGFSRQEYWNGFSCPPPGESSQPRIEPISLISLAVAGGFFTPRVTWEAPRTCVQDLIWK